MEITQIGSVKLVSTILQSVALILNKTFGTATTVLYATQQLTPMRNTTPQTLLGSTFSIPLTLLFIGAPLVATITCMAAGVTSTTTLLILGLSTITVYLATYEQLFIAQSATTFLLWPNGIIVGIIVGLSYMPYPLSTTALMSIFLLLRIATAIMLSYIANQRWNVPPLVHSRTIYIAGSLTTIIVLLKFLID